MELTNLTILEAHKALKDKKFSTVELTKAYLNKIKEKNKDIFAFLNTTEELALKTAKKVDDKISNKEDIHVLSGIPCAIKDNILVKGERCTAGSKVLESYVAPYDATVINKLKEKEAVILGKVNLDEFAMGSSSENSAFGPTKNPYDLTRVAGGSSGGSAAAVASDMALFSLGSDSGGSIRLPASFCGLVGLKPTYGAVSRYGLIAFASSLDQIGPFAKNVEDVQTVFEAIAGEDSLDSTSVKFNKVEDNINIRGLKIGIPKEYFVEGIDPLVASVVNEAIKKYEDLGAKIVEISLPNAEYALLCYYIIAPCEASANLARYDGIRYGYSKGKSANNLLGIYLKNREEGFGQEVKRRLMLGTFALSAGYYEDYYLKAQQVRSLIKNDFVKAFEKVDVIFTPTSPVLPFKIGEKVKDPLAMYLVDMYTASVNLAGLPALSLPIGQVDNLPVGLQIIGKPFAENNIFKIANYYDTNN